MRRFTVLLTAGPTRERLDPVRFLTNPSTGAMGLAIAGALRKRGARVILVLGPVSLPVPAGIEVIRVESALQMERAVKRHLSRADAFVATAAVGDWRFAKVHRRKMKKGAAKAITLRLLKNPDILANAGAWRARRGRRTPLLVGFSLETHATRRFAERKLRRKKIDLIIGNSPASFGSPLIRPLWIERGARPLPLPAMSKKALARRLAGKLANALKNV